MFVLYTRLYWLGEETLQCHLFRLSFYIVPLFQGNRNFIEKKINLIICEPFSFLCYSFDMKLKRLNESNCSEIELGPIDNTFQMFSIFSICFDYIFILIEFYNFFVVFGPFAPFLFPRSMIYDATLASALLLSFYALFSIVKEKILLLFLAFIK